ncbi:MAG: DUF308 domain-containing protein [Phycisphaerales bacterium]|jgi:uncharacterized membrane protein HdeD (DUF308 family)|nr:DUF308 domain-containing protein [Phycisphaerales bacterium]
MSQPTAEATPSQIRAVLRQGRGVLLFEAIVCLLGGFGAIIYPVSASEGLELFLGVVAIMLAILGFIRCVVGGAEHLGSTAAFAVLIGAIGVMLLVWPFEGLKAITLLLAAGVMIRGISDVSGFPARSMTAPGLQVISGIAGIVVAVLLILWYPSDALWAPGLLFGIQLIFFGMMLLSLWSAVRGPEANPPATEVRA